MKHDQNILINFDMGSRHSADDPTIPQRDARSTPAGQSLVGYSGQHGQIVEDSSKPADQGTQTPSTASAQELVHLRDSGHTVSKRSGERCSEGQLGSLGSVAGSSDHAVCLAEEPRHHLLRISETVALFNSTPIGRVLNERQLLRHRISANHTFVVGNTRHSNARIDVLRYVAWLTDRLHANTEDYPIEGDISYHGVYALLAKQNYCCALTGRPLRPADASLDHMMPVSRQGLHRLENAQALHQEVNRAKNAMTNREFISLCREVVAWADRRSASITPEVS